MAGVLRLRHRSSPDFVGRRLVAGPCLGATASRDDGALITLAEPPPPFED
ncbi:hypothetical protein FM125_05570 [Micrococcus lylae]|uniref:Uncharacterized protein n=1 Tax=Micrococcus lylae TaxID=1273 RepID=A0A1R4IZK2_9MICC|nr:hypothetical protein FM125_05570 [Micrococcus lylae]